MRNTSIRCARRRRSLSSAGRIPRRVFRTRHVAQVGRSGLCQESSRQPPAGTAVKSAVRPIRPSRAANRCGQDRRKR